jgi:hypothetical protein
MQKKRLMLIIILLLIIVAAFIFLFGKKITTPRQNNADSNTPTPVVGDTISKSGGVLDDQELADLRAANAQEVDSLQVDVKMTNADGTSQGTMKIITDGDITQMVATSPEGVATIIYTS